MITIDQKFRQLQIPRGNTRQRRSRRWRRWRRAFAGTVITTIFMRLEAAQEPESTP